MDEEKKINVDEPKKIKNKNAVKVKALFISYQIKLGLQEKDTVKKKTAKQISLLFMGKVKQKFVTNLKNMKKN